MKKSFLFFTGLVLLGAWASPLRARPARNASETTASNSAPVSSGGSPDGQAAPFQPYWQNQFQLGYSSQQAGQVTGSLSYTGTDNLDEAGDFLSCGAQVSRQKVEGVASSTGSLTVQGGLTRGFFSPSLSLGFQGGENALRQVSGNLNLGFQLWDPLALSLSAGGNAGSHNGDVTAFFPLLASILGRPVTARIDTAGWNASAGPTFTPWDWLTASLWAGYEYDVTYQVQSISNPSKKEAVNEADRIGTLTLDLDFTPLQDWDLDFSPQAGREYYPAGAVYSPKAGGLVYNSTASSKNFVGWSLSAAYSFQ